MKLTKKSLLLPVSIFATALITGGVAYALTSNNFASQAATWATANCTAALSASKATSTNEQKSITCYSYNKSNENTTAVLNLQSSVGTINNNITSQANSIQALQQKAAGFIDFGTTNVNNPKILDTAGYSYMLLNASFIGSYGNCIQVSSSTDQSAWTSREKFCSPFMFDTIYSQQNTFAIFFKERYCKITVLSNNVVLQEGIIY
jgi:hypothetical protein